MLLRVDEMGKSSLTLIKEWQIALGAEIGHLKNKGSKKYLISNGRIISSGKDHTYYFESKQMVTIPNGSIVKVEWAGIVEDARMLSSEGKGVIISLERNMGVELSEAYLVYDPWQLLDELSMRLDEIKKSKNKRARIKRLLDPKMPQKHPIIENASRVKELFNRSKYNPVTYVWGPPGTGKTYTLARVAANKYLRKKKVLILSQSNAAVDILMKEIFSFLNKKNKFREGEILRYGNSQSPTSHKAITMNYLLEKIEPELIKQKEELLAERLKLKSDLAKSFSTRDSKELLKLEKKLAAILDKSKVKEKEILKNSLLIGTTLARAATDSTVYENDYDLVIVDEASMCYVPQAAFAASLGKRVIICGDFKQLPPIAQSNNISVIEWLKEDIFHKSGVANNVHTQLHPHLFLLNEQRRMHPEISSFTNKYIYHSFVKDHSSVVKSRKQIVDREPFAERASILLDTSFTGPYCVSERSSRSRLNPWQLLLSFQLIHEAYTGGARSIGYVTPYRAQANLMNELLEEFHPEAKNEGLILSATVHKFQGSEKEVVVFDSVEGGQESPGMLLTGKESERLINVAITRTKGKFIHVANVEFMKRKVSYHKTIRKLIDHQIQSNQRISHQAIGTWIRNHHPNIKWLHAIKKNLVFNDIKSAKTSIIISIPNGGVLPEEWLAILKEKDKKVKLTILSNNPEQVNGGLLINESLPFPMIAIDQRYLWIGQPFQFIQHAKPPLVAVRIESKRFIEEFFSHLPLTVNL